MDESRATEILKGIITAKGNLCSYDVGYLAWNMGETTISMDGYYGADELEALAWWMRNKNAPAQTN